MNLGDHQVSEIGDFAQFKREFQAIVKKLNQTFSEMKFKSVRKFLRIKRKDYNIFHQNIRGLQVQMEPSSRPKQTT